MNTIEQSQALTGVTTGAKIPFWRQLRWNLIIFAVLLTVIPVLVIGWFFLQQARLQTITQINRQLESVISLKENEIDRWLNTSNQVMDIFLSKATSSNLLVNFATEGVGGSLSAFVNATLLDGVDSQGVDDAAFKEFFLYDLNGKIIASSNDAQVGKIVSRQPYFAASLAGKYVQSPFYDVGNSELTMVVTRPVAGVDGITVAIIAGRLNLTTLGNIMTERSGLGETGETYLVSLENNYLLTPSRFEGYTLNRAYHSLGIDDALNGKNGVGIYPDYRNIPVIGFYRWNPELNAAFLAEVDEAEALAQFNQTALISVLVVVLAAIGAAAVAFYYATRVSQPIVVLTGIASRIAAGDLTQRAELQERNEIGILASTFNSMTDQLQNFVATLEDRVNARTRDLQIVASVSKSATTILNVDDLLQSVVDLTKQSFDLYHAHIYLLDESGENLVLTAGAGEPGRVMKEQGRQITLNNPNSLVARAGRTHKGVIENDITRAPDFLPHPLLPNTKSELAVPMVVGDRLIGVLDVQADIANRFTDEDVAVQTSLGDQIAVAIENARAFARIQEAQAELQHSVKETQDIRFALDQHSIVAVTDQRGIINYANDKFVEISGYRREELLGQDHRIVNSDYHSKDFIRDMWVTIANGQVWKGEIKNKAKDGRYYWVDTTLVPFLNDQGKPYQYIAIRTDITEHKRQEAEIAKRAAELETVAQVSAATSSILDMNEMLLAVTDLTKDSFGLYHAHVYLLDDAGENLVLAAGAGKPGRIMKEQGRSIPINHPNSLVARAASSREGAIANDVTKAPDFLANPLLPDTKSEMAVPMVVGDKLIGVLDVQSDIINRFSEDDVRIQTTLADQIAVAIENSHAFARIQEAQAELQHSVKETQDIRFALDQHSIVAVTDQRGIINYANDKFVEISGYRREELLGQDHRIINSDYHSKDFIRDMWVTIANGQVWKGEIKNKAKDGRYYWVDTSLVPFLNDQGKPYQYIAIRSDITERKEQEQEEHILYEISRDLSNAKNSAGVLEAMSGYLATRSGSSATLFHIDTEEGVPTWLETAATRSSTPEGAASIGSRFYLPEFPFSSVWMSHPNEPVLIGDMETLLESDPAAHGVFKQFGISATAVIPLYSQDRWLGLITFSWNEPTNFNAHDERILTAVMRQATSKVDALRSAEITAKRAAELQTVAQVSAAATMILETDALLQSVVDLTKDSFNLYHAHVYLMDESGENLVLAAGAGEPGRIMKEQGRSISLTHQNSLVARAARSRDSAIANNVTQASDFLPNPLLPETKSEMAIPLIVGDEIIGVLDLQSDVINRFSASDAMIQSTLADQIAVAVQNARAFKITQETAERLREVDRLKSQFLANMSHELRTPLNSIIGYAEVLLDGIDGELGDEAIEDVQAIHGGGKHLLTIINDILDLAKIEAGQMFMDRQEAKLTNVVDEVVGTCQILAKNKDISLNVEMDGDIPTVFGDTIRLKQIIFNLVNNAIKFTEKGGVTVNLGMMNDNNEVVVAIHDTGMGMTQEDMGGLFQQFHQVDGSATRRAGGTGLGLVITRHLVHMHGGEIYVESEKGAGSTFWFTLPVYANQPRQKA